MYLPHPARYHRKMLLQVVGRVFRSNLLARQTFRVRHDVESPDVQFRLISLVGVAADVAVMLFLWRGRFSHEWQRKRLKKKRAAGDMTRSPSRPHVARRTDSVHIDFRCLERRVTEDGLDLRLLRTAAKHLRGARVTKAMRSNAGASTNDAHERFA